jgi:hypothetical protein
LPAIAPILWSVRLRDEFDRRSALARLRVELHQVEDHGRHLGADRQAEFPRLADRDGIVVGPRPAAELLGHGRGALLGHPLGEEHADRPLDLPNRLLGHVRLDDRGVVDPRDRLALDHLQDRDRRRLAELRVERTQHGVLGHDDLVGGERDERSAAHRVVRHEHRHLGAVTLQGMGDLVRGQDQPTRRVEDQVDGDGRIGELDRTQQPLRILDVDVAGDREAEEAHRLLAVDQPDGAALALFLELAKEPHPLGLEQALAEHGLQRRDDDEQPQEVDRGHASLPFPRAAGDAPRRRLKS